MWNQAFYSEDKKLTMALPISMPEQKGLPIVVNLRLRRKQNGVFRDLPAT
jgi:hypothetical protein